MIRAGLFELDENDISMVEIGQWFTKVTMKDRNAYLTTAKFIDSDMERLKQAKVHVAEGCQVEQARS